MPILCREPSLYPDDLLDRPAPVSATDRWWVLYTRARQEKAVARRLLSLEIPFFVPLVPKTRIAPGRRTLAHIPLFAGYVFLYGSAEQRIASLETNRVSRTLPVSDAAALVQDLQRIRRLIESGADLRFEPRLVPGQAVRVAGGALAGLEGIVLRRCGQTRLVVSVDFIQQGASIQIDDFLLEPVE